jgi:hypothetical protein
MKKVIFFPAFIWCIMASGQVVPLRPENWTFGPGKVEFKDSAGVALMKVALNSFALLKNTDFGDGTIEYDIILTDPAFSMFVFHFQDSLEYECFYFRTETGIGHPYAMDAVQYAPSMKGILCWDMLPQYQTNARFWGQTANHVKLVISGKQMRVFVNSKEEPTLAVPCLEGNVTHGTLAFAGGCIVSNLVLRRGQVEGLPATADVDPTATDPRYLRHWLMTEPDTIPPGIDFKDTLIPGKQTAWKPIEAGRFGVVNLTRLFGGGFYSRRIVWLKTSIKAEQARRCQMRFGFLDEVWVFLNGKMLYVDKNLYGKPIAKDPDGRLSLDNTTFSVPLKQGDNELLVGVASNFYTWGIVARLDDLNGISIERGGNDK